MNRKFVAFSSLIALMIVAGSSRPAAAPVRLENICTIGGQSEIKLVGIGLVVGLSGTGDGGKSAATIRALAQTMKLHNAPVVSMLELKDAKNVALVHIMATIPRTGLRYGQKIDCFVTSAISTSTLRGGRLLVAPVEEADIRNDIAVGLASGAVVLEDATVTTTGKIPGGIVLRKSFYSGFIDRKRGNLITLLLNPGHVSFYSASEIADAVNLEFRSEAGGVDVARPAGPGAIEVKLFKAYERTPVRFVATLLNVAIEHPHSQAIVRVNTKTGTVIVTGEVEISPTLILKNGLQVSVGSPGASGGTTSGGFVPLADRRNPDSSAQLKQLMESLNELRVPPKDIIEILRDLNKTGKLHAQYVEE